MLVYLCVCFSLLLAFLFSGRFLWEGDVSLGKSAVSFLLSFTLLPACLPAWTRSSSSSLFPTGDCCVCDLKIIPTDRHRHTLSHTKGGFVYILPLSTQQQHHHLKNPINLWLLELEMVILRQRGNFLVSFLLQPNYDHPLLAYSFLSLVLFSFKISQVDFFFLFSFFPVFKIWIII